MKGAEFKQIIEGVYVEKLSLLLTNLQSWDNRKSHVFGQLYVADIQKKLHILEKNEKEVNNQLLQFIKMLNLQYQFLSKLKKQGQEFDISPAYPSLQSFAAEFAIIKDSLLELSDFLGKFIGVTNYQYVQIKKIYDEASQAKARYEHQKARFVQNYHLKKETIYSKKNTRRHFEMAKILDLVVELEKERKIHEETCVRLEETFSRHLQAKQKMYKNIVDNLQFVAKLYQSGFRKDILSDVISHFNHKLHESNNELAQFTKQENQLPNCEHMLRQLREQFYKYFDNFVEEITVGNWSVCFTKKHENHTPHKVANDKEATHIFLTFDKKIFFYKLLKREIEFEQNIEDVKIYEPVETGKLQIKDKKTKQKYVVLFQKVEKQDQFYLHLNQMCSQK